MRLAVRDDWPEVVTIHSRAIHEIASADYPTEVLNAWHDPNAKPDLTDFDEKLRRGQVVVVAEVDDVIAGFGELIPDKNELLAIYVSPDYSRQGVGAATLGKLECIALDKRLSFLQLASSLTAVPFYEAHGYQNLGRDVHVLQSGGRMDCIRMKKELT